MSLHAVKELFTRWKLVLFVGFLFAAIAAGLSFLLPFEYRADAQVLIISQSRFGVDPYTVVKSAERIGENLVQIMYTDDFYQKVIAQSAGAIDTAPFDALDAQKKREAWTKTLSPSVVYGTSLLNISVYNTDKDEALDIARATVDTLKSRGWEYVGGDVIIREVNAPAVTDMPVRPNIILNALIGAFIGVIIMSFAILRKARSRNFLHKW